MRVFLHLVALLVLGAGAAAAQTAPQLTQIRGGLYRLQSGDQSAVVLVASNSVLIADPLDLATGQWLRAELASRFPGRPVQFVVYTSHVFERASGGGAFSGATFVAHREFNTEVLKARTLPASLSSLDHNRDGRLQEAEWRGNALAVPLIAADRNKDRDLTPREIARMVPLVKQSFRESTTLSVGGTRVELVNPGGSGATPALFFPAERVLYVGVNPAFAGDGFTFGTANAREVLAWLRGVAKVDFDVAVTGNGETLTPAQFQAVLRYAEDLNSAAANAYIRRWSVDRAAAAANLQKYSGNRIDARRRANIDYWFRTARVSRMEIQGAGFARMLEPDPGYCETYDPCSVPDYVVGGSGALRMTWSSLGLIVEGSFGPQYIAERQGFFDDEAFAQRSSRGSLLFRVGRTRPSAVSIDFLVGPTLVSHSTSGVTRVKQAVAPRGGRHPFSERTTNYAVTGGMNLVVPLSPAISLYVPIRATWLAEQSSALSRRPSRLDAQVGIGFSIRMTQQVR